MPKPPPFSSAVEPIFGTIRLAEQSPLGGPFQQPQPVVAINRAVEPWLPRASVCRGMGRAVVRLYYESLAVRCVLGLIHLFTPPPPCSPCRPCHDNPTMTTALPCHDTCMKTYTEGGVCYIILYMEGVCYSIQVRHKKGNGIRSPFPLSLMLNILFRNQMR
jgi:hypothetical protein